MTRGGSCRCFHAISQLFVYRLQHCSAAAIRGVGCAPGIQLNGSAGYCAGHVHAQAAWINKGSIKERINKGHRAPVKAGVKQGVQVPHIERNSELR